MYIALHFSGSSALFLFVLITFSPSPLHSLPLPLPLSFLLLFALVQGVPVGGDSLGFPDLECSTLRGNLLSAPNMNHDMCSTALDIPRIFLFVSNTP